MKLKIVQVVSFALISVSFILHAQTSGLDVDDIVAKRGGVELTVGLIDQEIERMPDEIRDDYMSEPSRVARVIDKLLLTKQLGVKALHEGYEVPDEFKNVDVEDSLPALTAMANQLLRKTEVLRSEADYEQLAEERYLVRKMQYASEELFKVRILSVSRAARGDIVARTLVEAARSRAEQGADFAELIVEHQEGDSTLEGDVAAPIVYSRSQLVGSPRWLRVAISSLEKKPGISEVLEDDEFYYLVQFVEYVPAVVPPFEEVKARIVEELREETINNAKTTIMRSLSLQDVELNPDVVSRLGERYVGEGLAE